MRGFFERFADRIVQVSESGCMIWTGATYRNGYGAAFNGKTRADKGSTNSGAHRLAYEAAFGPIPDGAHVLHRCDVRCCVNPEHLFLGDQAVNMADMARKGRSGIGSRHSQAKMTEQIVLQARAEYHFRRTTYRDLAEKFGVNEGAMAAAVRRDTWKHI